MSYGVVIPTKNGASTLKQTLDSILSQTMQPANTCVVNDGSTDETMDILETFRRRNPRGFHIVNQPDRGYDIRRVPANINLAYADLETVNADLEYFMISGDDCVYPKEYAHTLISRMSSDSRIVVASGQPMTGGHISQEHLPSGGGRMVRCSFWRNMGNRYPVRVGWEAWLLYKALEKGFGARLFNDLIYENLRPRGTAHQFRYWGAAMYALGYHPLYALGRVAWNLVKRNMGLRGSVNMLEGYMLGSLGSSDPFISTFQQPLRNYVRIRQSRSIAHIVRVLVERVL